MDDPRRKALVARRCKTANEVANWVKETFWEYKKIEQDRQEGPDKWSIGSIPSIYSETAANAALVLIEVTMVLLERQLEAQGEAFLQEGGFTERLYKMRKKHTEQP